MADATSWSPDERDRHVPPGDADDDETNADGSMDVDLPADDTPIDAVEENDDGSATVNLEAETRSVEENEDFYSNLAEDIVPEDALNRIAFDLLDDIERDQQARSKRDEQYADGIRRTGLGDEAPGGADFEGASRAVHPVLVEGCIDFAARAMKELFPAAGPVKTEIVGEQTEAKVAKAERKRKYMNWQCRKQIKEYRREMEVLLTQLPLGGSQYLKFWRDRKLKRTRCEFAPIDNFFVPFEATDIYTASRQTQRQVINRQQFDERIISGQYREIPAMGEQADTPKMTAAAAAAAKVEGNEDLAYNEDGLRTVYETQMTIDLSEYDKLASEDFSCSYIVTVDESTQKILALRRNWAEDDDTFEALDWVVEFPFIPWRGAYAIGLGHIIGGLSSAATGALRALLDSAQVNNFPAAVKLAAPKASGQTVRLEPLSLTDLEGPVSVDDIRKLAMALPFNPPSMTLFSLLEWLTDQAKGVVATAEEKIGDATNNMPVGTALALIEQGSVTFSAIHSRLHASQEKALSILHRLNATYMEDEETVEELGELVVTRADFQGPMDVAPVSDPNIFSDGQRYAQIQSVLQLMEALPQLFDTGVVVRRTLQMLKVPTPDELLTTPEEAKRRGAIDENVISATEQRATLKIYKDQDHLEHLKMHVLFMSSPILGLNDMISTQALPKLLTHCRDHIIALYQQHANAAIESAKVLANQTGRKDMDAVNAVAIADQELAKIIGPLMQALQAVQQKVQQIQRQAMQAQMPPDNSLQVAQIKAQQQEQSDQQKLQAQMQESQQKAQQEQQETAQQGQLTQMQQKLDQFVASQKDATERWQTMLEMRQSGQNADAAATEGEMDRRFKMQQEQLQGVMQEHMAGVNAKWDMIMEAFKQHITPPPEPPAGSGSPAASPSPSPTEKS